MGCHGCHPPERPDTAEQDERNGIDEQMTELIVEKRCEHYPTYTGRGARANAVTVARFNEPRIARINIASGLDAVDGAFSTLFGPANLASFFVCAYQIDPGEVNLGDPIDVAKRLNGTPTLLYPPRVA